MATEAQTAANRGNALRSSGPRAEAGKANSFANPRKLGLNCCTAFVRPGEEEECAQIDFSLRKRLAPAGALEEAFAAEIVRATYAVTLRVAASLMRRPRIHAVSRLPQRVPQGGVTWRAAVATDEPGLPV
jgi:hypothetical protein